MLSAAPTVSASLAETLVKAIEHAGNQLALLVDRDISFQGTHLEYAPLEELPVRVEGGPERIVTAVYLAFSGDIDGHIILSFTPEAAAYLATILLMTDDGADLQSPTMRYLADSMVGELGNVAAAGFLNAVAEAAAMTIHPSPPCVVHDMLGALLDSVIVEMASSETRFGLLLRTVFVVEDNHFAGDLILLPSLASCERLERILAAH